MRPIALVPLACAITGFILGLLSILAGHTSGFMEDYHIMVINTTMLGKNLLPTTKSASTKISSSALSLDNSSTATSPLQSSDGATVNASISAINISASALGAAIDSGLSSLQSSLSNLTNSLENELNALLGDAVMDLSKILGIKQWYSFHVMNMCEGSYIPQTQNGGTLGFSTTNCTRASGDFGLSSVTSTLDKQLSSGPLSTTLEIIQVPSTLQTGLDSLSAIAKIPFILYIIGLIFAGLVIPFAAFSFLMEPTRLNTLLHIGLSNLAFAAFFSSSIIITIVQYQATNLINMLGKSVGLQAASGTKYLLLTWLATVVMGLGAVVGGAECCLARRKVKDRGNGWLNENGVVVKPGLIERVRGVGGKSIADRIMGRFLRGKESWRLSDKSALTPV